MSTFTIDTPQCWQDVESVLNAGIDRLILFGPPGTGKTFAGLHYGNVENGAFRIICNEDMTSADITGYMKPSGNDWRWVDGQAIKAWDRGARVVADEINLASGDVLSLLLAMFDSPESAEWEHPETGQVHKPQPGFSVVMTTNVEDMDDLPQALKDRFPVAIRIDKPHPAALMTLSPDLRSAAMASADADGSRRFSMRAFKAFDTMRKSMDDDRAARLVFGSRHRDILDAIRVESLS
jgi:MoxR-like ATPase